MFVPVRSFQLCLMFVGKARSLHYGTPKNTILIGLNFNQTFCVVIEEYVFILLFLEGPTLKVPQLRMLLKSVYNNFCFSWTKMYFLHCRNRNILINTLFQNLVCLSFQCLCMSLFLNCIEIISFFFLKILQNNILNYCK